MIRQIKTMLRPLKRLVIRAQQQFYRLLDRLHIGTLDRFPDDYFTGREEKGWNEEIGRLVAEIQNRFAPASVLDVGCGAGAYLKLFERAGSRRLAGLEGSPRAVALSGMECIRCADLREYHAMTPPFDLTLCIEVAPYINDKDIGNLLRTLADGTAEGGTLLFSASDRFLGGKYHVNLKPREEWISLLEAQGMIYQPRDTQALRDLCAPFRHNVWLHENLMVLRKACRSAAG